MKIMKNFLGKSMALVLVICTILMSVSPTTAEAAKKKSSKATKTTHTCVAGICEPHTWSYYDRGDGTHSHAVNSYIRCVTCKKQMDEEKYRAIEKHDYGTVGRCICGALQPHVHNAVMCAVVSDVYTEIGNGLHWLRRIQVSKCSCGAVMETQVIDIDSPHEFADGVCVKCGHECQVESCIVTETIEATEKGHYRIQDIKDISCCGVEMSGKCVKSSLESHSYEKFYDINHPHYLIEECVCHYAVTNQKKKQTRDDCPQCMFEELSNSNRNGLMDAKEFEENLKKLSVPGACTGEKFVNGNLISETASYMDLSGHVKVMQYEARCVTCGGTHTTDGNHRLSEAYFEPHTLVKDGLGCSVCSVCKENITLKKVENTTDTVVNTITEKTGWNGDIIRTLYYELKDLDGTLEKAGTQVVAGNYASEEDVTLLGTALQIALGFTNLDFITDARDLSYDISHWDELEHKGQTFVDALSLLLPVFGCIKSTDEVLLLQKISKIDVDAAETLETVLRNTDLLGDGKNTIKIIDGVTEGGVKSGFRSQELLDSHYERHGKQFGNITKEEYIQGAKDLINSKSDDVLVKVREDGDILYYHPNTNEFAIKSADGYIRTYFKPSAGIDYFNKQ